MASISSPPSLAMSSSLLASPPAAARSPAAASSSSSSPRFDAVAVVGKGGAGVRTVESLQLRAEQASLLEEGMRRRLEQLDAEIDATARRVTAAKAAKRAATGKGANEAGLAASRSVGQAARLKEQLLARLRLAEDRGAAELGAMRARVDALRVEAMDRDQVFEAKAAELAAIRAGLVAALERSNAALASRNEVADQLRATKAEAEQARLQLEARQRAAAGELDALQQAVVAAAGGGGGAAAGVGAAGGAGASSADDGPGSGEMTEEQEAAARATIVKLERQIREYEAVIAQLHAQTRQLQEVFKHMIAQAGLERLDQLVERFAEQEAFKYEIFGYVAHTNGETKQCEEMLRDVRAAQARYLTELAADAAAQASAVAEKRAALAALRGQVRALERHRRGAYALLARVLHALLRVYAAAGGADPSRLALVAEQARTEAGARRGVGSGAAPTDALARSGDSRGSRSASAGGSASASGVSGAGLAMSRDETLQVLGELEQLVSDLCLSFLAVARSPQGREQLQAGAAQLALALRAEAARLQAAGLYDGPLVARLNEDARRAAAEQLKVDAAWEQLGAAEEEGGVYFWNRRTNETVWDRPAAMDRPKPEKAAAAVAAAAATPASRSGLRRVATAPTIREAKEEDGGDDEDEGGGGELAGGADASSSSSALASSSATAASAPEPDLEPGFRAFSAQARRRHEELQSLLAECAAVQPALAALSPRRLDAMLKALHREPAVPARAVAPQLAPPTAQAACAPQLSLAELSLAPLEREDGGRAAGARGAGGAGSDGGSSVVSASARKGRRPAAIDAAGGSVVDGSVGSSDDAVAAATAAAASSLPQRSKEAAKAAAANRGFGLAPRFERSRTDAPSPSPSAAGRHGAAGVFAGPSGNLSAQMSIASVSQWEGGAGALAASAGAAAGASWASAPLAGALRSPRAPAAAQQHHHPQRPLVAASEHAAAAGSQSVAEMLRAEAARREQEAARQAADKERELLRLQAIATANYFAGGAGSNAPIRPPNMQLILDYNAANAAAAADAEAAAGKGAGATGAGGAGGAGGASASAASLSYPRDATRDRGVRVAPELIQLGPPPEASAGSGAMTPRRVVSVAGAPRASVPTVPAFELLDAGDVQEFDVLRKQYGAPPTLRKASAAGAASPRGASASAGGLSSPYQLPVLAPKPLTAASPAKPAAPAPAQLPAAREPTAPAYASRPGHTLVPPAMERL